MSVHSLSACNACYHEREKICRKRLMYNLGGQTVYAKPKYSPPAVMAVKSALRRSSYDSYSGKSSSIWLLVIYESKRKLEEAYG